MRLFVAADPPLPAVQDLERGLRHQGLPGGRPDLRWVPAAQWHLTLAFLGEVDEGRIEELCLRLARAATRHPPLPARICATGTFGPAARARVLWAGLDCDRLALRRLAESVRAAARRSGIDIATGRFHPHVTLARARQPRDLTDCTTAMAGYHGPAWAVDAVRLVRSSLGAGAAGRPVHETVRRWPLRGG